MYNFLLNFKMPIEIGFFICYNLKNIIEYAYFVKTDKTILHNLLFGD